MLNRICICIAAARTIQCISRPPGKIDRTELYILVVMDAQNFASMISPNRLSRHPHTAREQTTKDCPDTPILPANRLSRHPHTAREQTTKDCPDTPILPANRLSRHPHTDREHTPPYCHQDQLTSSSSRPYMAPQAHMLRGRRGDSSPSESTDEEPSVSVSSSSSCSPRPLLNIAEKEDPDSTEELVSSSSSRRSGEVVRQGSRPAKAAGDMVLPRTISWTTPPP